MQRAALREHSTCTWSGRPRGGVLGGSYRNCRVCVGRKCSFTVYIFVYSPHRTWAIQSLPKLLSPQRQSPRERLSSSRAAQSAVYETSLCCSFGRTAWDAFHRYTLLHDLGFHRSKLVCQFERKLQWHRTCGCDRGAFFSNINSRLHFGVGVGSVPLFKQLDTWRRGSPDFGLPPVFLRFQADTQNSRWSVAVSLCRYCKCWHRH